MNLEKDKYIILEIIPSRSSAKEGTIIQLQALKLDGLKLIDRFDYRLQDKLIDNPDLRDLISYDKESFHYTEDVKFIMEEFKKWHEDLPLLIIDNYYTLDYLKELKNKKESIFKYLNTKLSDTVFQELKDKYDLAPTDHLVDLLYESIIKESNNKEKTEK